MGSTSGQKQKLALVFGNVPTVDEIDQYRLLTGKFDITVMTSESICGYLSQTTWFNDLHVVALPDYDANPTYLPGLENALAGYDIVVVKERLGLYAYQAVKAKWRSRFRLVVQVDNLVPFPGEDVGQMRTIRREITNGADAFIVQTDAARQVLLLEGVEEARIFSFIPWVDTHTKRSPKLRAKSLETLGMKEGDFVVAHMGQLEWEEGLFELVHAAKRAIALDKSLARRLRLVFCGIGSFANELRDRLVQLGIDGRAVHVAPSRDAFATVIQAADAIFFSVSAGRDRMEGDPYRLLTAMANGLPVIASRSPVVEEFIGKHRIDFCSGSIEGLADALIKATDAGALTNNIIKKNLSQVENQYTESKARATMIAAFNAIGSVAVTPNDASIDQQVREVELKVSTKQYLAAIDLIEPMIRAGNLPPHHEANLYRLIGDSFAKLGDLDQGKNAYLKSVEVDPFMARAHIGLGTVALLRSSWDISVLHFQKAVSLAPEDEMANLGLGLAFHGMEETREANKWVAKACEINPENTAAIFTLVKIAYEREEWVDAETALRRYIERHPADHNMLYTLAGLLLQAGRKDEAGDIAQRILTADPTDSRTQQLLKQIRRGAATANSSGS
jgi:glycosyltransferase involved in cell wall biosynthesis/Tfp pilus assembly protein PilF